MKHLYSTLGRKIFVSVILSCAFIGNVLAQELDVAVDTSYKPPIKVIADPSAFGPYTLNTNHTNTYFVTDFPKPTTKVVMKYIDSKGGQLGEAHTETGSDIETVVWSNEAEEIGFVLSPQLVIEVHYSTDSLATYTHAYTVYPDTVHIDATVGWGPFFSNTYPLSDGWNPAPAITNTFSASNLPPRTDTVEFQILAIDSSLIKSHIVVATQDNYLDSVAFPDVRMDSLPLSTIYLRTRVCCEGGPIGGLIFYQELTIRPQQAKLISIVDDVSLEDSIGVFTEHEFTGQALLIDSVKYAEIRNGPGTWDLDKNLQTIYRGPYSFDLFQRSYTMETWLKFDLEEVGSAVHEALSIMSVDSVWEFRFDTYGEITWFSIRSLAVDVNSYIFTALVPFEDLAVSEWHHIAITSNYSGDGNAYMSFFFNGKKWHNTVFHSDNFEHIRDNVNYYAFMGTQPIYLGVNPALYPVPMISYITALDEVRLWDGALSAEEIARNFHKKILQQVGLVGYWNFDDMRNHLGYISDLSYNDNRGKLHNGATFTPQHPEIQSTPDSILFYSSNLSADTVIYNFIDRNKQLLASDTAELKNGGDTLLFDLSTLSDNVEKLNIRTFSPECPDTGFLYTYLLQGLAPIPIATPRYNWNSFYNADDYGVLNNPIVVSGLPNSTTKVILGLQKGDETYDLDTLTENSIPYRHSLNLNGTDNYIETSQNINCSRELSMSFWFKTTTTQGGKIIGFTDTQNGKTNRKHDREVIMEKDGSLRFYLVGEVDTYILSAVNKYNDGMWHQVRVRFKEFKGIELHLDGCLVDFRNPDDYFDPYAGYWIIGRNHESKMPGNKDRISEYFEGSICELIISDTFKTDAEAIAMTYGTAADDKSSLYYKFDEGKGTTINDHAGDNTGTLKGGSSNWFLANTISFVAWDHNILNIPHGTYEFFANVFYREGPPQGAKYLLGRNHIKDPFPEHDFVYILRKGFGYFNEGTSLSNNLDFGISNTDSDSADWKENFLRYKFLQPNHDIISTGIFTYTQQYNAGTFPIDMGDAPPGSYLSLEVGYHTTNNETYITNQIAIPLYINPLLAPIITGFGGPFDQAIAPGTMLQPHTTVITTEILSDLNRVVAKYYDKNDTELGETDAIKINDTSWHINYNMGTLSPPTSKLSVEYYLGANPHPALVQGPFAITIHKTRPKWFDFLPDDSFSEVQQSGDEVDFTIITPFEENWMVNNYYDVNVPSWLPLIGGTNASLSSANARANLKWNIPEHKLELNQEPHFYQTSIFLSGGNSTYLGIDFNTHQDNSYAVDSNNNLIASQNFQIGGTLSETALDIDFLVKKLNRLISLTGAINPSSIVVQPSFQIVAKGSFEYSSRLHLTVDTISESGGWGSFGNLDIDANPNHTDAYNNSASYHFYTGAFGLEFDIGLKFFKGIASVYFGLDGRVVIGYGHSYISIPDNQSQALKSAAFQIYGRAYIAVLWGWYSHNLWGPKMFYSNNFWGSDMSHCYPPASKAESTPASIPTNSSWPELAEELKPVHKFAKMQMPLPEPEVVSASNQQLFTWVERGVSYGERKLQARYLDMQSGTFSNERTIALNNNALNNPVSEAIDENLSFFCWAQTRYDNQTILEVRSTEIMRAFLEAQDIWVAIYDKENDSIIFKTSIEDDTKSLRSGRTEANPVVTVLSESQVMITWQVVDISANESELWYVLIEKINENWVVTTPKAITPITGIATQLEVAATGNNNAVITWLNSSETDIGQNQIMTAIFDGETWRNTEVLLDEKGNYYNYQSLNIKNGLGGLVVLTFVEDSLMNKYEKLMCISWDGWNNAWYADEPIEILVDSIHHLQLPRMAIHENGNVVIAFKAEDMVAKDELDRISQVDLVLGNLYDPLSGWKHIEANEYVCDTTKQLADLQISWVNDDTLMLISNEYPMMPTNTMFEPTNGVIFGDPYMNLVLRCFAVDEQGDIKDVDEHDFFTDIYEYPDDEPKARLYQNRPNPCREATTITFDIAQSDHAILELFDMTGNRLAVLMDQQLSNGRYDVELNTSLLKNGTYVYRLSCGKYTASMKMMVGR